MRKTVAAVLFLASIVVALPQPVVADTISTDLGTDNAANWLATVGGGGGGTPFLLGTSLYGTPTPLVSITSNGVEGGQWLPGSSNGTFNGFWYADQIFTIPANATNISLSFSNLWGDDRVVLELNGVIVGDRPNPGVTGPEVMSFPPGPPDVPYTFTDVTQGQVTTGFNTGVNDLRLIVNNTNSNIGDAPTRNLANPGDSTFAGLEATLTYSVPEPSTFLLLGLAAIGLIGYTWQRKRRR